MLPHKETFFFKEFLENFKAGHPLSPTASTLVKDLKAGTAAQQHNVSPQAR